MKFSFRKIGSVLASSAMMTSTIALAAAAQFPAPFVKNGAGDVAIVHGGAGAAYTDIVAVLDINTALSGHLVQDAAGSSGSSASASGTDVIKIEKSSTLFHLGQGIKDVVSTDITDDSPGNGLPKLLADGNFMDDDNDEFDFTQTLEMSNHSLVMFEDNDYKEDEPSVGMKITSGTNVFNYTLEFTDEPDWTDLATADLNIMGKSYYILSTTTNTTLNLLDSAVDTVLSEGQSTTLNIDGATFVVTPTFISSSGVKLDVNGEVTNSLSAGETQKLSDGSYVGVKELLVSAKDTVLNQVEFSIGKGKLELVSGSDVELNEDTISDLSVLLTSSGEKLQKIQILWNADDDLFVADGSEPSMPGFGAVKMSFGGMTFPVEEKVSIEGSSDTVASFKAFPLKDSDEDIDFLYANESKILGTGKDATNRLVTANETATSIIFDGDTDEYFVASWNDGDAAESYLMKTTSFKTDNNINKTTFQYRKNSAWTDAKSDAKPGDTVTLGNVELTVGTVNKSAKEVVITRGNSNVNFGTLYSKAGLKVYLPWTGADTTTMPGYLNDSSVSTFVVVMKEEDKNENIGAGANINATIGGLTGGSDAEVEVTAVSLSRGGTSTEILDTDVFRNFVYSDLASEILWKKPSSGQNSLELMYHGEESYGNVFLTSSDATVTSAMSGTSGSTGAVATTGLGSVSVTDSEVGSAAGKNLIVIGGSCVNSVAAELLGVSASTCGADFTSATTVGSGQFLIQSFARTGGKVATLVAGYNAGDTTNGAKALTTQSIDTSAGKKYTGTSATSVTASVDAAAAAAAADASDGTA